MDYEKSYGRYSEFFEKGLAQLFLTLSDVPEPLLSAMKYSLEAGGKRIRPVLLLSACDIFGGDLQNALPFAVAVELIHTYSLIHDDLPCMDDDDLRRGMPTNHKVFGEGMATLAGDALLNLAYEHILSHIRKNPSEGNLSAALEIAAAAGCLGMVAGQSVDLYSENNPSAGERELEFIHAHKTGKLICASLAAGAYAAEAGEEEIELLRKFGEGLGVLFQITDDILDMVGSYEQLGKSVGKDGKQNKLTYPRLYGLEKSRRMAEEKAEQILEVLSCLQKDAKFLRGTVFKVLNRNK
jgi:geranylgeranyl diphosphate synthase type II